MFKETCNLHALPSFYNESNPNETSLTPHILSAVSQNHEILDFNYNWSQLFFLEADCIKKHDPVINHGLKTSQSFCFLIDTNFKHYVFDLFKRFYDNLSVFRSVYTFVK